MVVPDFELICEIMLVAEGFLEARLLARKFITLYTLCKELLSKQVCALGSWGSPTAPPGGVHVSQGHTGLHPRPAPHTGPRATLSLAAPAGHVGKHILSHLPPQDHYDWGLRAIKSVLVVAGSLKRGDPARAEDQVLMRALRDFNIPKIVTDDLPVFMGLIGDLFPALDVPRKRDLNFEKVGGPSWALLSWGAAWTGPSPCCSLAGRSLAKTAPVGGGWPECLPCLPGWPPGPSCPAGPTFFSAQVPGGAGWGSGRGVGFGQSWGTHPRRGVGHSPGVLLAAEPALRPRSSSRVWWSSGCRPRTASC